jgi:hypothetical protein
MEWYRLDSSGLGHGPVKSFSEHGNELSGSTKYVKILKGAEGLAASQ